MRLATDLGYGGRTVKGHMRGLGRHATDPPRLLAGVCRGLHGAYQGARHAGHDIGLRWCASVRPCARRRDLAHLTICQGGSRAGAFDFGAFRRISAPCGAFRRIPALLGAFRRLSAYFGACWRMFAQFGAFRRSSAHFSALCAVRHTSALVGAFQCLSALFGAFRRVSMRTGAFRRIPARAARKKPPLLKTAFFLLLPFPTD